jgi:hypothetical protein
MSSYEQAEDELCNQVNNGEISEAEFRKEMRYLRDEFQAEAEGAAQEAYDDCMGRW